MPYFEAIGYREPDGQYTWVYLKDGNFQVVGGQNQTLDAAVTAAKNKIATEANVANTSEFRLAANIP